MDKWAALEGLWQWIVAVMVLVLSVLTAGHAVLYKRDPRAAFAWALFAWVTPVIGPVSYLLFGVNRIRRRAALLRGHPARHSQPEPPTLVLPNELARHLPVTSQHLVTLAGVGQRLVATPLVADNHVELLCCGDIAYPVLLKSIRDAKTSITLATYIFERDCVGKLFVEALQSARERGVEVRVLIDGTGVHYSIPSIVGDLQRANIPVATFLPASILRQPLSINLRNHRKILVIDGAIGFTGGMNIRMGHWHAKQPKHPVQDIHFKLTGPVVTQLQETFLEDWHFTTGESLGGAPWFAPAKAAGEVVARVIADGPDEDFERLRWCLMAAVTTAKRRIRIVTPYFLPDTTLIATLNLASLRGVEIDIYLPAKCNLPYVQWASRAHWWQLLERGCRIWLTPPPFDHSKLMVIDDAWCMIGSANWDPRSLRLNFELNVECYSQQLALMINEQIDLKQKLARQVGLQEVDQRPLPTRFLDGIARLASPYL
jgi:cardiolipin synthase